MAKTNLQKLKEALDKGDLEAAKKISEKLAAEKKPAGRPKRARPAKPTPAPPPAPEEGPAQPEWLAPSRKAGQEGRATRVAADGTVQVRASFRSMAGEARTNTFKDTGKGGVDAGIAKVDRQLAGQGVTPRNKAKVSKVDVRCEGCNGAFSVYPSYLTQAVDENFRPYTYYKCDRCIRRGR